MLYVGTDIIEIKRIRQVVKRHPQFWDRILTPLEKEYCRQKGDGIASLAGRFAAKEAVLKCTGRGLSRLSFRDLEILPDSLGCPQVYFSEKIKDILAERQISSIQISISHCHDYAMAVAIGEGEN